MLVTVHVSKHYDWEPLPAGIEPTEKDMKSLRVKPAANGGWLMRTTKERTTHTSVSLPETQIIALVVEGIIRDKIVYTRAEAVGHYLARHVMPGEAHRSWMTGFEVHDESGADSELFAKLLEPHVESGKVAEEDMGPLLAAYTKAADHVDHLHKHFGVARKKES